ncbi:MAG: sulfotransferase [Pseudomonadota bacterium]|nr:sulfotransferase [Pseudomonadota bacterium]
MKNIRASIPRKEVEIVYGLYSKGKIDQAIKQIKTLNEKYPNQPLLFNLIGACYKETDQLEGAAKMFRIAISIEPNYAEAHFNLGVVLQDLDQKDESIESYKKAIAISPNYPDAHNNLGNIYIGLDQYEAGIESFEWAIAYKNDFAEAYYNLGNAYNDFGNEKDAIINLEKAIKYNQNYEKAYFNLALIFKYLGDEKRFLKNIEKAIDLKPDWGHAYYHLSRSKKFVKDDPHIDEMKSFLKRDDLPILDRIGFNFALSKAFEDLQNNKDQFKFLNEANSLRKKEMEYTIEKDQGLFSIIKDVFQSNTNIVKTLAYNAIKVRPIFILGMPRSGTSLVHQILDSHIDVHGVGELNNLNKIIMPLLKDLEALNTKGFSENEILSIRNDYISSLPMKGIEKKIIVDKMPINFRYIGFILSAFPEAKIIHMNRDPMATCWSIYKYEFRGNAYSFDQKDIAAYYLLYRDLMDFWNKFFPDKIYDLYYEKLTISQEEETRKLLDYCDLEWDENCLNFYNNNSAVKTTSSMQVRKKMYQGSSEAWRKYESYLQPLIKGLNYYQDEKNESKRAKKITN